MTEIELAWVAGLLEGEGCFATRYNNYKYLQPYVEVNMTDKDVLEKLNYLVEGRINGPYTPNSKNAKDYWRWGLYKIKEVEKLITAVYPHMGKRRKEKINILLKAVNT